MKRAQVLSLLWRWSFRGLIAGFCVAIVAGVYVIHYVDQVTQDLPDVHKLSNYHPPQVTRILARDGSLLSELFTERRTVVPMAQIPDQVKLAFVAAEDAYFFEHQGLNYLGMLRALLVNLRSGKTRQGGSTITQQVVKNALLEDSSRTYRRKVREVVLSYRLEKELTKEEILGLYLNHIYFGGGRYGVQEAARYYFGKDIKEVTLGEAAMLASLPAGPEYYSPRHNLDRALARRAFVLDQMAQKHFLVHEGTDEQNRAIAEKAKAEPLRLAPVIEAEPTLAPEVTEEARKLLETLAGDAYSRGGFTVTTTIDPKLQAAARKAIRDTLDAVDKLTKVNAPFTAPAEVRSGRHGAGLHPFEGFPKPGDLHKTLLGVVTAAHDDTNTLEVQVGAVLGSVRVADASRYNPQGLIASQFAQVGAILPVSFLTAPPDPTKAATPEEAEKLEHEPTPLRLELGPEGALVALDPKTRDILALVGSYEGVAGGLDRVTQMKRQPGSTFKPIYYSEALHTRRFTPATIVDSALTPGAPYTNLKNDGILGDKPIRLREGLARSLNGVALRVMKELGPVNVLPWAESLGITSKLGTDLSLALGAYEVAPMEIAGAYATFAAGGVYVKPHLFTRVVGPDGEELKLPAEPPSKVAMSDAEAYLITSMLTSVVDHGTGARARELHHVAAGKTGTTNEAKDAWFVGYTTDLLCAVWTGFDDPKPMLGGEGAGATIALPAWLEFMKVAEEHKPPLDFTVPPGITTVRIDPTTGLRAREGQVDAMDEVFLAGTEPQEVAPVDSADAGVDGGSDAGVDAGSRLGSLTDSGTREEVGF